jgi:hypothetical protein
MSQSSPVSGTTKTPLLSSGTYNILKHVASIGLPLLNALFLALAPVWHWPDVTQVSLTIAAINTILGGTLGYSTATYNASEAKYAGVIEVAETDAKKVFSLNLNQVPEELEKMAEATFKVVSLTGPSTTTSPPPVGGTTAHGASV